MGGRCVLTLRVGSLIMALFFIGFFNMWRDSMTGVTWLISYVWHDSASGIPLKLALFFVGFFYLWHDSFISLTWLIHMYTVTHSYVCRDAFICGTWLIYLCDVTLRAVHLKLVLFFIGCFYLWRDSLIFVTWLISYVGHDSSSGVFEVGSLLYRLFLFVTWLIHMCDVTHFICVTWLFEWCLWSWLSSL